MKKFAFGFLAMLAGLILTLPLMAQIAPPATQRARVSPHETINAIIDGTYQSGAQRMVIIYGRPYSKEPRGNTIRKIWGGLVPWGQVWRMGADEATLMVTSVPIQFGDLAVPAGAYSLYMLPVENGTSKLIINKQIGQWGINGQGIAYTDEMKPTEVGRVDLKKDALTSQVDQFSMGITPKQGGGGGTIKLWWENALYSVDFTVKK